MPSNATVQNNDLREFSTKAREEIEAILARYPDQRSATLPILHLAQREFGHISPEVEKLVAGILERPVTEVHGVVTFYTMFRTRPVGRYHLQLCRNISCWLNNAPGLLEYVQQRLGIEVGQTTSDGKFTLSEVECLGHCEQAPALQINDEIIGNLTKEKIDQLLNEAK